MHSLRREAGHTMPSPPVTRATRSDGAMAAAETTKGIEIRASCKAECTVSFSCPLAAKRRRLSALSAAADSGGMTTNISSVSTDSSTSISSPTFSSASATGGLPPSLAWPSSADNSPITVAHDDTSEPSPTGFGHCTSSQPLFNNKQAVVQAIRAQEQLFQGDGQTAWWQPPALNNLRKPSHYQQQQQQRSQQHPHRQHHHHHQQQQQQQQPPPPPYGLQAPTQPYSFVHSTNVDGAFDAASTTTTAGGVGGGGGGLQTLWQGLSLPELQHLLHQTAHRKNMQAVLAKQQQEQVTGSGLVASRGNVQQQHQEVMPATLPPALPAAAMVFSLPSWISQRPPGGHRVTVATNTPPAFTAAGIVASSTSQTTGFGQATPARLFPPGFLSRLLQQQKQQQQHMPRPPPPLAAAAAAAAAAVTISHSNSSRAMPGEKKGERKRRVRARKRKSGDGNGNGEVKKKRGGERAATERQSHVFTSTVNVKPPKQRQQQPQEAVRGAAQVGADGVDGGAGAFARAYIDGEVKSTQQHHHHQEHLRLLQLQQQQVQLQQLQYQQQQTAPKRLFSTFQPGQRLHAPVWL